MSYLSDDVPVDDLIELDGALGQVFDPDGDHPTSPLARLEVGLGLRSRELALVTHLDPLARLVDVQALAHVEGQLGVAGGATHQANAVALADPRGNLALKKKNQFD